MDSTFDTFIKKTEILIVKYVDRVNKELVRNYTGHLL